MQFLTKDTDEFPAVEEGTPWSPSLSPCLLDSLELDACIQGTALLKLWDPGQVQEPDYAPVSRSEKWGK